MNLQTIAIVIFILALIHLGKSQITVEYLYGGPRLDNGSFIDSYFHCNAEGQNLEMTINGEFLVSFVETDSGEVSVGNGHNFTFFATLISVNGSHQEGYRFDAILIVSGSVAMNIEVMCTSDLGSNTTDNNRQPLSKKITSALDSSGVVLMQQLFSGRVVPSSDGVLTHVFICGAQLEVQFWTVESVRGNLQFDTSNRIGFSLPPSSSTDPFTFRQLAFLCANEPYQLVTVMFLTGNLNTTVTCTAGQYNAQLRTADLNSQDPTEISVSSGSLSTPERIYSSQPSSLVTATEFLSKPNMVSQAWRNELTTVTAGLVLAVGILLKRQLYC